MKDTSLCCSLRQVLAVIDQLTEVLNKTNLKDGPEKVGDIYYNGKAFATTCRQKIGELLEEIPAGLVDPPSQQSRADLMHHGLLVSPGEVLQYGTLRIVNSGFETVSINVYKAGKE